MLRVSRKPTFLAPPTRPLFTCRGNPVGQAPSEGRPTAPWLPVILTQDGSFGVRSNEFGFNLSWDSGQTVVVEASSDLAGAAWLPISTNVLFSDSLYVRDPFWTNISQRFYRNRSP